MGNRMSRHRRRLDEIDQRISSLGQAKASTKDKTKLAAIEKEIAKMKEEKELRLAIVDLKEKQESAE